MKLSEIKNEEAIDVLADIIEPLAEILSDKELAKAIQKKEKAIKGVSIAIKNHKSEVIQILARLDGVPVEDYSCNVFTLPIKVMELLNDKELLDFFKSQGQVITDVSFGSATENTEVKGK